MKMKSKILAFTQKFESLKNKDSYIRIDENHPLDIFIGLDSEHKMNAKILIPSSKLDYGNHIFSTKGISVEIQKDTQKNSYITLTLMDDIMKNVYLELINDIFDYSSIEKDKLKSFDRLIYRYNLWIKLFEKRKSKLTINEVKGLLAELLFIKMLMETYDEVDIINGWLGSELYHQDFVFHDSTCEIKATRMSNDKIKISSLEQLSRSLNELYLIIMELEQSPKVKETFTTNEIILSISTKLNSQVVKEVFMSKLYIRGYDSEEQLFEQPFKLSSIKCYNVKDDFPRLTINEKSKGILDCTYHISKNSLHNFEIAMESIKL